jgi:hypothetical protein
VSLAISVGILAGGPNADPDVAASDREALQHVNRTLAENDLPLHEEPESLPEFPYRGQLISFPYEWLFRLQRAVAFARRAPGEFRPLEYGADPAKDRRLQDEWNTYIDSHLICHSYSEGFYVPIDFGHPLVDSRKEDGLPGLILGSSVRGLAELMRTAPLLSIPLKAGVLTDENAKVLAEEPDEAHPYWIERKAWFALFEPFRHSVEYKCAVVFG